MRDLMKRLLTPLLACLLLLIVACSSPEGIVLDAVGAASDGDRDALLACLTERSRPIMETYWNIVDVHRPELGALTARNVTIGAVRMRPAVHMNDPDKADVTIREGDQQLKLVLHATGATWRIDLLDTERALMDFDG
jgi:hypothetical protein